jgi:ribonuclease P protein component
MLAFSYRLCKHADYQRVYAASRKCFGKQISYFYMLRQPVGPGVSPLRIADPDGPRIGLTVGKAMGKAVERNRIKRRMREAIRRQLPLLHSHVDVVLHPRRSVIDVDFTTLQREMALVFQQIQRYSERRPASLPLEGG